MVRGVARSGYVASGLLRVLIGVLALALAAHVAGARPDASGAFGLVSDVPGGVLLLALVAAGDFALGLWLVARGFLHRDPGHPWEGWRQRLVYWGRAGVYLVIGASATRFALGAHEDSARNERAFGRFLLDVPGGVVVLALIGGVIVAVGVGMVWIGLRRQFVKTIVLPDAPALRRLVTVLGVVGYALQGASIAVVGVFVVLAAFTLDPRRASGLSGTLATFAGSPSGRVLLVAVGIGWVVAGVYALLRARIGRVG